MPQTLRDPSVSHDSAVALILVVAIMLIGLGMVIGGLALPRGYTRVH